MIMSQILPPEFTCIKDDTLFWSQVTNGCGPFLSVDIFRSDQVNGPYTLLSTITDPNVEHYVDNDPGAYYYYLQSNHSCSGQNVIPSDTLGNQFQTLVTKIERVSVQGNDVSITWFDNGSAQNIGYIIYRITPQGTLPIDTMFSGLSYQDTTADPQTKSESYYVLGMNACGSTNTFDDFPHSTILLQTDVDFCNQHIKLTWNSYEHWNSGIESNDIWLGVDGAPIAYEHRVGGLDTLAYVTGLIDDTEYCISVIAKQNGTDISSASNTVCVVSDVLRPIMQLAIRNVSINSAGDPEILWFTLSDADFQQINLYRGEDTAQFQLLESLPLPKAMQQQYQDVNAQTGERTYFYQIKAMDQCDGTQMSNYASTVHLSLLSAEEGENQIAWTPLEIEGRMVTGYQICRSEGSIEMDLTTLGSNEISFVDEIPSNLRDQRFCYLVKALHTDRSGNDPLISKSNQICAEQEVQLYIPNAFVPEGNNREFLPKFVNEPSSADYSLSIYNRWGGKVFESFTPAIGWDGSQNGQTLSTGVYLYQIKFKQPDGKQEVHSGTVTLIK